MTTQEKNSMLEQKRAAVVDAFLAWNRWSPEEKRQNEDRTLAERVARTMRLEGEQITADDVRRIMQHL